MEQPKVSVITICRNAASELDRTVRSVVAQEGVDLEFVTVDQARRRNYRCIQNKR